MTRTEIIAELRRSAVEDADPCMGVTDIAWEVAANFRDWFRGEGIGQMEFDDCRTFFLLCAVVLEDE